MNVRVLPTPILNGSVSLPPSKSYSVRAVMIAACGGQSRIISLSQCDDALAALSVARSLGARIFRTGEVWHITANAGRQNFRKINVKESGTVLRMLLPLVALTGQPACVVGEGTLKGRPNRHLIETLRLRGVHVSGIGPGHSVPVCFSGGIFRGGAFSIDGSMSSQFVSALLMACPMISQSSRVHIAGSKVSSADYITMTMQVMAQAGVVVDKVSGRDYRIIGGQRYKGLKAFRIPSDYGLAAFLMAAAVLTQSDIRLTGFLNDQFIQADAHILAILKKMGVIFHKTSRSIRIKGPFSLKGGVFSLKDSPDLLPILSIVSLFADRPTKFLDIAHVRVKESDRISDLRRELMKVGARIDEGPDFMVVHPLKETECKHGILLNAHQDHRLAMALCVLGLRIGTKVKGVECVAKSYPKFLRDLRALGAKLHK